MKAWYLIMVFDRYYNHSLKMQINNKKGEKHKWKWARALYIITTHEGKEDHRQRSDPKVWA